MRLWIGIGLLVVLLAMGIGLLWGSSVFFQNFIENLEEASDLALSGNWQLAVEKAEKSRKEWDRFHDFWSAFTDHEPVEEIENLFSQLQVYQIRQLEVDFSSVCRSLVHLAEAMEESHGIKWWSVL